MFWSTKTAHPTERASCAVISLLDGLVAFATLESYGVVDGRDERPSDLARDRARRARRRAALRADCLAERAPQANPRERRGAAVTGLR
jgi:hypothetical protein